MTISNPLFLKQESEKLAKAIGTSVGSCNSHSRMLSANRPK